MTDIGPRYPEDADALQAYDEADGDWREYLVLLDERGIRPFETHPWPRKEEGITPP